MVNCIRNVWILPHNTFKLVTLVYLSSANLCMGLNRPVANGLKSSLHHLEHMALFNLVMIIHFLLRPEVPLFLFFLSMQMSMVIAGNDIWHIQKLKKYLSTCFSIKDLGTLKYFLGLGLAHYPQGIYLCQRKYTLDLLKWNKDVWEQTNCFSHSSTTLIVFNYNEPLKVPSQYCRLIKCLIYLTISQPNITYVI